MILDEKMTVEEMKVHMEYIIRLLKEEKGITCVMTKLYEIAISTSKNKKNKFILIDCNYDGDDYITIQAYAGNLRNYEIDHLSDPKAYEWLVEIVKHYLAIQEIHQEWGIGE
jgi:DeoR/GlpR family transcriptional regulator of sugar metabolism